MKKVFILLSLITISCSHDCPTYNPCDCILVTDPVTWQSTNDKGQIVHTTYFVGKNECKNIAEPMTHITTNINKIPKEFTCYKSN